MFEDLLNGKNNLAVFHPGHATYKVEERAASPTLKELQKCVGGYIEVATDRRVPVLNLPPATEQQTNSGRRQLTVPVQVIVNEEGLLRGMPINLLGTAFIKFIYPEWSHTLVGPVVVLAGRGAQMK